MIAPYSKTVLVRRGSGEDRHGDPLPGGVTETPIKGVVISPRGSSESHDAANTVIVGATLYGPYDADIRPTDQIVDGATVYDIEGEPGRWSNPFTGTRAGVQVALRRVTG